MYAAELESKIFNTVKPEGYTSQLVDKCENRLILRNTQESRTLINELVQVIKGNMDQIKYI